MKIIIKILLETSQMCKVKKINARVEHNAVYRSVSNYRIT